MANTTTTVNHSDLPCTCTSMDQYVDGLCPGCIEAADRDADLKEHLDDSDIDPPFDYSTPEDEGDSDRYGEDGKGHDHPEFDD